VTCYLHFSSSLKGNTRDKKVSASLNEVNVSTIIFMPRSALSVVP
jgi:hypothetical protein